MSATDKAKNKAKDGAITDNKELQAEGQADQAEAGVKQAGEHVKEATADAGRSITTPVEKS